MLNRFVELVQDMDLTLRYITQPVLQSREGNGAVVMVPSMTEDEPDLEMGVGY